MDVNDNSNEAVTTQHSGEASSNSASTASSHLNDQDDMIDVEDAVRCLFDTYTPTVQRKFQLDASNEITIVSAEEEDPGALQSGVYLWPASNGMMKFLSHLFASTVCNEQGTTDPVSSLVTSQPSIVCELGAGCGLTGLVYAKLWQSKYPSSIDDFKLVLTDRDAPLLQHIQSSIQLNHLRGCDTCQLVWGSGGLETIESMSPFQLVLGADLLYSTEAIYICFETVEALLNRKQDTASQQNQSKFLLCSSFRHPDSTRIIEEECVKRNITRALLYDEVNHQKVTSYAPVFIRCCGDKLRELGVKVLIELFEKNNSQ